MTLSDHGPQHPQTAAQSTSENSASSTLSGRHGRLSPMGSSEDLLASWSDHAVDVKHADQLLESSLVQRQATFQYLVRHYICQILYGCENANCTARTCLSSVTRSPARPIRPPTQLTARVLAHYLACQSDAKEGLCPNTLKVSPSTLEVEAALGAAALPARRRSQHYSVSAAPWRLLQIAEKSAQAFPPDISTSQLQSGETQNKSASKSVANVLAKQHQNKKDAKSISQNLFDSATVIYSYSKQIPAPASVLESVQFAGSAAHSLVAGVDGGDTPQTQTQSSSHELHAHDRARESMTSPTNGVEPHASTQPHSGHEVQNQQPLPTAEAPRTAQQIHRIPYNPDRRSPGLNLHKANFDSFSNDVSGSPKLLIMKTGRKNFTLGATMTCPTPTIVEAPATKPITEAVKSNGEIAVLSNLKSDVLRDLKNEVYRHRNLQERDMLNHNIDFDPKRPYRPSKPLVNRSLFYTLSNPEILLKSFHDYNPTFAASPLPHLDSASLSDLFSDWSPRNGALVFDSLCIAVDVLLVPPPVIGKKRADKASPSTKTSPSEHRYLNNLEAAHIVMICIHALTSHAQLGWPHIWKRARNARSRGVSLPNDEALKSEGFSTPFLYILDAFEYEPAVRLANRLLRGIGSRVCFEHIVASAETQKKHPNSKHGSKSELTVIDIILKHLDVAESAAMSQKQEMGLKTNFQGDPGWTITSALMEWLKTIIMKQWESRPVVEKWSSVGTAIRFLDKIHRYHTGTRSLHVHPDMFELPLIWAQLDAIEEPIRFLAWRPQPNHLHILEYPILFSSECLVKYFRTMNFHSMMAQYNHTTRTGQLQRTFEMFVRDSQRWVLNKRMKVSLSEYLFLDVTRQHPLVDTLNQLWNVERRALRKPLKVKLGKDEGEVGLDHGGVTYEFFRVVLSEAFHPDYGMFTVDPKTHMTWFQPNSIEPEWKFEMIGIIFSLAVYNGITLPVTFPLALYRFLLPHDAPLHNRELANGPGCIKDGWPELAKSFEQLLNWTDGDVGDVIMRDYAFSYEVFGQRVEHNMEEEYIPPKPAPSVGTEAPITPPSPSSEPKLVTNANRKQFVVDYIKHLIYLSIEPQITAFRRGFNACLEPESLRLFSPTALRALIEGNQIISDRELAEITEYEDGYYSEHPTIEDFWNIVQTFDQDDLRRLLEFVTASDRVPVSGYQGIVFHIVRYGGAGEVDRLPTSSTCFGKLYLPEYDSKERLREKLMLAIRNSKGFGVV